MTAKAMTCCTIGSVCLGLAGCVDATLPETEQWMQEQRNVQIDASVQQVPPVIDTPPAIYKSSAPDPFSVERLNIRPAVASDQTGVVFSGAPLSALILKGYLVSERGEPVAMVVYENQYRAIRAGDRLSEARALVKKIDPRGALLVFDGAPDQWMLNRNEITNGEGSR